MPADDPVPDDCTRCAACCFSESPRHARVTGDDHRRLGEEAEQLVEWIGNAAFMRLERVSGGPSKCIALTMDPKAGTFGCSIYETRPQVCRDLARGSGECRGELATKGDRPKRALVVVSGTRSADERD
jgi:Fe-S-cluster containining protein